MKIISYKGGIDIERCLVCEHCGKKLPIGIDNIQGIGQIRCFCKHCKKITLFRMES